MTRKLLLSVCLLVLLASMALGQTDPLIYDNGAVNDTGLSSQIDTVYPFESGVADDFVLPANPNGDFGWTITGVTFTGLQFGDPPDMPASSPFVINIYNDAGGSPFYTGDGTTPPGPDAIFSITATLDNDQPGPFSYAAKFEDPGDGLKVDELRTYWMSTQSINTFPPQWGWEGSAAGGNAVQGFPLLGTPFWTGVGANMNFELYGFPNVPEPATGLLLLAGLLGLVGVRQTSGVRGVVNPGRNGRKAATRKTDTL